MYPNWKWRTSFVFNFFFLLAPDCWCLGDGHNNPWSFAFSCKHEVRAVAGILFDMGVDVGMALHVFFFWAIGKLPYASCVLCVLGVAVLEVGVQPPPPQEGGASNTPFPQRYQQWWELLFTLWLDSRFPHRQTSSGESRLVHLQLHHPEHRCPTGLCPEPPALFSIHSRLRVLSQLHFYRYICWWYCGSGPH